MQIDWNLFFSTFALIFVAELPDKTVFATLLMATEMNLLPLFLGVCVAFLVQNIVAVAFGNLLALLPEKWVHLFAGLLFVAFALYTLMRKTEIEDAAGEKKIAAKTFWMTAWSSFLVIFIAEWGDLTQLITASLVAKNHNTVTIFIAATLSLWVVTGVAVLLGAQLKKVIRANVLKRIAAVVFLIVGAYFIWSWVKA